MATSPAASSSTESFNLSEELADLEPFSMDADGLFGDALAADHSPNASAPAGGGLFQDGGSGRVGGDDPDSLISQLAAILHGDPSKPPGAESSSEGTGATIAGGPRRGSGVGFMSELMAQLGGVLGTDDPSAPPPQAGDQDTSLQRRKQWLERQGQDDAAQGQGGHEQPTAAQGHKSEAAEGSSDDEDGSQPGASKSAVDPEGAKLLADLDRRPRGSMTSFKEWVELLSRVALCMHRALPLTDQRSNPHAVTTTEAARELTSLLESLSGGCPPTPSRDVPFYPAMLNGLLRRIASKTTALQRELLAHPSWCAALFSVWRHSDRVHWTAADIACSACRRAIYATSMWESHAGKDWIQRHLDPPVANSAAGSANGSTSAPPRIAQASAQCADRLRRHSVAIVQSLLGMILHAATTGQPVVLMAATPLECQDTEASMAHSAAFLSPIRPTVSDVRRDVDADEETDPAEENGLQWSRYVSFVVAATTEPRRPPSSAKSPLSSDEDGSADGGESHAQPECWIDPSLVGPETDVIAAGDPLSCRPDYVSVNPQRLFVALFGPLFRRAATIPPALGTASNNIDEGHTDMAPRHIGELRALTDHRRGAHPFGVNLLQVLRWLQDFSLSEDAVRLLIFPVIFQGTATETVLLRLPPAVTDNAIFIAVEHLTTVTSARAMDAAKSLHAAMDGERSSSGDSGAASAEASPNSSAKQAILWQDQAAALCAAFNDVSACASSIVGYLSSVLRAGAHDWSVKLDSHMQRVSTAVQAAQQLSRLDASHSAPLPDATVAASTADSLAAVTKVRLSLGTELARWVSSHVSALDMLLDMLNVCFDVETTCRKLRTSLAQPTVSARIRQAVSVAWPWLASAAGGGQAEDAVAQQFPLSCAMLWRTGQVAGEDDSSSVSSDSPRPPSMNVTTAVCPGWACALTASRDEEDSFKCSFQSNADSTVELDGGASGSATPFPGESQRTPEALHLAASVMMGATLGSDGFRLAGGFAADATRVVATQGGQGSIDAVLAPCDADATLFSTLAGAIDLLSTYSAELTFVERLPLSLGLMVSTTVADRVDARIPAPAAATRDDACWRALEIALSPAVTEVQRLVIRVVGLLTPTRLGDLVDATLAQAAPLKIVRQLLADEAPVVPHGDAHPRLSGERQGGRPTEEEEATTVLGSTAGSSAAILSGQGGLGGEDTNSLNSTLHRPGNGLMLGAHGNDTTRFRAFDTPKMEQVSSPAVLALPPPPALDDQPFSASSPVHSSAAPSPTQLDGGPPGTTSANRLVDAATWLALEAEAEAAEAAQVVIRCLKVLSWVLNRGVVDRLMMAAVHLRCVVAATQPLPSASSSKMDDFAATFLGSCSNAPKSTATAPPPFVLLLVRSVMAAVTGWLTAWKGKRTHLYVNHDGSTGVVKPGQEEELDHEAAASDALRWLSLEHGIVALSLDLWPRALRLSFDGHIHAYITAVGHATGDGGRASSPQITPEPQPNSIADIGLDAGDYVEMYLRQRSAELDRVIHGDDGMSGVPLNRPLALNKVRFVPSSALPSVGSLPHCGWASLTWSVAALTQPIASGNDGGQWSPSVLSQQQFSLLPTLALLVVECFRIAEWTCTATSVGSSIPLGMPPGFESGGAAATLTSGCLLLSASNFAAMMEVVGRLSHPLVSLLRPLDSATALGDANQFAASVFAPPPRHTAASRGLVARTSSSDDPFSGSMRLHAGKRLSSSVAPATAGIGSRRRSSTGYESLAAFVDRGGASSPRHNSVFRVPTLRSSGGGSGGPSSPRQSGIFGQRSASLYRSASISATLSAASGAPFPGLSTGWPLEESHPLTKALARSDNLIASGVVAYRDPAVPAMVRQWLLLMEPRLAAARSADGTLGSALDRSLPDCNDVIVATGVLMQLVMRDAIGGRHGQALLGADVLATITLDDVSAPRLHDPCDYASLAASLDMDDDGDTLLDNGGGKDGVEALPFIAIDKPAAASSQRTAAALRSWSVSEPSAPAGGHEAGAGVPDVSFQVGVRLHGTLWLLFALARFTLQRVAVTQQGIRKQASLLASAALAKMGTTAVAPGGKEAAACGHSRTTPVGNGAGSLVPSPPPTGRSVAGLPPSRGNAAAPHDAAGASVAGKREYVGAMHLLQRQLEADYKSGLLWIVHATMLLLSMAGHAKANVAENTSHQLAGSSAGGSENNLRGSVSLSELPTPTSRGERGAPALASRVAFLWAMADDDVVATARHYFAGLRSALIQCGVVETLTCVLDPSVRVVLPMLGNAARRNDASWAAWALFAQRQALIPDIGPLSMLPPSNEADSPLRSKRRKPPSQTSDQSASQPSSVRGARGPLLGHAKMSITGELCSLGRVAAGASFSASAIVDAHCEAITSAAVDPAAVAAPADAAQCVMAGSFPVSSQGAAVDSSSTTFLLPPSTIAAPLLSLIAKLARAFWSPDENAIDLGEPLAAVSAWLQRCEVTASSSNDSSGAVEGQHWSLGVRSSACLAVLAKAVAQQQYMHRPQTSVPGAPAGSSAGGCLGLALMALREFASRWSSACLSLKDTLAHRIDTLERNSTSASRQSTHGHKSFFSSATSQRVVAPRVSQPFGSTADPSRRRLSLTATATSMDTTTVKRQGRPAPAGGDEADDTLASDTSFHVSGDERYIAAQRRLGKGKKSTAGSRSSAALKPTHTQVFATSGADDEIPFVPDNLDDWGERSVGSNSNQASAKNVIQRSRDALARLFSLDVFSFEMLLLAVMRILAVHSPATGSLPRTVPLRAMGANALVHALKIPTIKVDVALRLVMRYPNLGRRPTRSGMQPTPSLATVRSKSSRGLVSATMPGSSRFLNSSDGQRGASAQQPTLQGIVIVAAVAPLGASDVMRIASREYDLISRVAALIDHSAEALKELHGQMQLDGDADASTRSNAAASASSSAPAHLRQSTGSISGRVNFAGAPANGGDSDASLQQSPLVRASASYASFATARHGSIRRSVRRVSLDAVVDPNLPSSSSGSPGESNAAAKTVGFRGTAPLAGSEPQTAGAAAMAASLAATVQLTIFHAAVLLAQALQPLCVAALQGNARAEVDRHPSSMLSASADNSTMHWLTPHDHDMVSTCVLDSAACLSALKQAGGLSEPPHPNGQTAAGSVVGIRTPKAKSAATDGQHPAAEPSYTPPANPLSATERQLCVSIYEWLLKERHTKLKRRQSLLLLEREADTLSQVGGEAPPSKPPPSPQSFHVAGPVTAPVLAPSQLPSDLGGLTSLTQTLAALLQATLQQQRISSFIADETAERGAIAGDEREERFETIARHEARSKEWLNAVAHRPPTVGESHSSPRSATRTSPTELEETVRGGAPLMSERSSPSVRPPIADQSRTTPALPTGGGSPPLADGETQAASLAVTASQQQMAMAVAAMQQQEATFKVLRDMTEFLAETRQALGQWQSSPGGGSMAAAAPPLPTRGVRGEGADANGESAVLSISSSQRSPPSSQRDLGTPPDDPTATIHSEAAPAVLLVAHPPKAFHVAAPPPPLTIIQYRWDASTPLSMPGGTRPSRPASAHATRSVTPRDVASRDRSSTPTALKMMPDAAPRPRSAAVASPPPPRVPPRELPRGRPLSAGYRRPNPVVDRADAASRTMTPPLNKHSPRSRLARPHDGPGLSTEEIQSAALPRAMLVKPAMLGIAHVLHELASVGCRPASVAPCSSFGAADHDDDEDAVAAVAATSGFRLGVPGEPAPAQVRLDVDLSQHYIGDRGLAALVPSLCDMTFLRSLSLSRNGISAAMIPELVDVFTTLRLFSMCQVTVPGGSALSGEGAATTHESDGGLDVAAWKYACPFLETLDLSHNAGITPRAGMYLVRLARLRGPQAASLAMTGRAVAVPLATINVEGTKLFQATRKILDALLPRPAKVDGDTPNPPRFDG